MDITTEPVTPQVPNRYSLVVLAAKRAKQIKEGAPPLVACDSPNALTIALAEIEAHKISYIEAPIVEDDEVAVAPPIVAAAPAQPTAMQMLTDSLDEAERAAQLIADDTITDSDETIDIEDSADEFLLTAASSAEEE